MKMSKIVREDGTVRLRIIAPGQGSSAYYEADQLKRDRMVFKNAQVFLDHPSASEEKDRPERSIRDLCAMAVSDPIYEDAGPVGPGLYTDVKVFKPYQPLIEELGPHIGVSIRASGTVVSKKISGKPVKVAEKFTSGGFDFVTKAGAGGSVVPLRESAKEESNKYIDAFLAEHPQESESSDSAKAQFIEWATKPEQEDDMELKEKVEALELEKKTLTETMTALAEEKRKLSETLIIKEAGEVIEAALIAEQKLPDITKKRVRESLTAKVPVKEEKLDKDALKALISETIKTEKEYIESLKPKGIVGMGTSGETDEGKKRLRETFVSSFLERGETKEKAEKLADLAVIG
jgi:hypothetical protein